MPNLPQTYGPYEDETSGMALQPQASAVGSKVSPADGRSLPDYHRIWERMPLDS